MVIYAFCLCQVDYAATYFFLLIIKVYMFTAFIFYRSFYIQMFQNSMYFDCSLLEGLSFQFSRFYVFFFNIFDFFMYIGYFLNILEFLINLLIVFRIYWIFFEYINFFSIRWISFWIYWIYIDYIPFFSVYWIYF